MKLKRCVDNPLLMPNPKNIWESDATFNPCVVKYGKKFVMLYRTTSKIQRNPGDFVSISSIGIAKSEDGIHFGEREFFFGPEMGYEAYGCEDPRISKFGNKYYIFYTAVSNIPPQPKHVRLAIASTKNFEDYEKMGIACPFNSKAGFIFPRKINGQMCMMFTLYPDLPPSKFALFYFDKFDELFDRTIWEDWLKYLEVGDKIIKYEKFKTFVEVGSPPIETEEGWLLFIPDIIYENGQFLEFRISAMLLDLENPAKVIAISDPLLYPEVGYEKMGRAYPTTQIAMPTGAVVVDGNVYVYYGASDLFCCMAYCSLDELLKYLIKECRA